jgi:CubicO group peptidase (beta-lactamase class C family)
MLTKLLILLLVASVLSAPDFTKVNDIFREMINERAIPGGSIIVANETTIIYRKNFGYLTYTYQMHDVEVTDTTKYDIASLTKPIATIFNAMNLLSSSSLKLDDLVSKYVTNYDTNKKGNTTLANLMLHNSGLPYDYPNALPRTTDEVI